MGDFGEDSLLQVDEELFLQATKTLFELENGEAPFELLRAVHTYTSEPYLAARFAHSVGREYGGEERQTIGLLRRRGSPG